jgi:ketosteroid isomerase-like protein
MRFLKGVIHRDSGKTAEAIATFTRLTEDYPELPEPYNNLAVLYASQSQFDKARAALEMAIRTNPSYATAHENLGDVYAKLASQAYNKALQLDTNNQAVPPKLALIRELFSASGAKGQRPSTSGTGPAPSTPPPAANIAGSGKPPPTLPGPAINRPPAAPPVAAVTPPAAAPAPASPVATREPATPAPVAVVAAPTNTGAKEAEAAIKAWAAAWSTKDVKSYLAAYGKDFDTPGSMKRSAWEEERRQRITSKSTISVRINGLNVTVNGNKAVAKFRQDYRADELAFSSQKTLDLVKVGEKWLIVRESTGS